MRTGPCESRFRRKSIDARDTSAKGAIDGATRRMYHAVVRRTLATALLVLFSFSLIPPSALAPDPDAGLPACCRRNGKHHCSLTGTSQETSPAVRSLPCGFFPVATGLKASPKAGVPATPLVSSVSHASASVNQLADETPSPVLFHSPRQQRGPPTLFLS